MQVRKLDQHKVQESLQEIIEDAEMFGQTFIELRHHKNGDDTDKILGLDSIVILKGRNKGESFTSPVDYAYIKDGCVYFYPDKKNRRWGYCSDTPKNRLCLATSYKTGNVIITDTKIRGEIIKLCEELGLPTSQIVVDHTFDNYLSKGKRNKEKIQATQTIEELRALLAATNAKLAHEVDYDISVQTSTVSQPVEILSSALIEAPVVAVVSAEDKKKKAAKAKKARAAKARAKAKKEKGDKK